MPETHKQKKLAEKPSSKHPGCNVVLYQLERDYATWIETTVSVPDYPVGYKAWGHYFTLETDARDDFSSRN